MSVKTDLKLALTALDIATRAARTALAKSAELNDAELRKAIREIDEAEAYIRRALKNIN